MRRFRCLLRKPMTFLVAATLAWAATASAAAPSPSKATVAVSDSAAAKKTPASRSTPKPPPTSRTEKAKPANTPPVARIESPSEGSGFTPGVLVSLVGQGEDAQDRPEQLTYQWDVDAVGGNEATRIFSFKGRSATFVPTSTQDASAGYEIRLVVTDRGRMRDTARVRLHPAAGDTEVQYTLGPGDVVEVEIYAGGEKQEDFTASVSPGGTLTCPLIGEVRVAGLTSFDVASEMKQLLARDFFVDPQVLLSIKEHARKIFVSGEVKSPGAYNVQEGLTVLSACTLAGGFTDYAALNRVKVLRNENGRTRTLEVDLTKVRRGKDRDLAVLAGDRIDVPHRRY